MGKAKVFVLLNFSVRSNVSLFSFIDFTANT